MFYIGVDVAKGRWLTVILSECKSWEVRLYQTIIEIWDDYVNASLILIDVPIGLREEGSEERLCDKEARKLLGWPRRSSVFRVPCRAALSAKSYHEAHKINKDRTGKGLAKQSWGIILKIREVDMFLNENISARARIRESHPEVCFWALNHKNPLCYYKKSEDGIKERINVLNTAYPYSIDIFNYAMEKYLHREVAGDDILDALVGAITARFGYDNLKTLPENPEVDAKGLRMEMVFYPMPKSVLLPFQLS